MPTRSPNRAASTAARRARALAWIALVPWVCAQAQAQTVQKCRIDGRLVYQASPCPLEPRALAAAPPAAPASAPGTPKKKGLADLLRERDASNRAPDAIGDQGDGANILRARMGAV